MFSTLLAEEIKLELHSLNALCDKSGLLILMIRKCVVFENCAVVNLVESELLIVSNERKVGKWESGNVGLLAQVPSDADWTGPALWLWIAAAT